LSQYDSDCWSCQHLQGLREVSRAPRIYEGSYWNVEHVPDTSLPGWIVIVLQRHAPALHDLSAAEFNELGKMMPACINAVHDCLSSAKEYVMQFAESDHFQHVHFHIVPRSAHWPDQLQGPRVFGAIGDDVPNLISVEQMSSVAGQLKQAIHKHLDG